MHGFRLFTIVSSAAALLAWSGGCGDDDGDVSESPDAGIVDVASGSEDFESFSDALTMADLDMQLSGEGPFTVFAPTDEAFEDLAEGTLDELSQAELRTVLLYHVVEGRLSRDVLEETEGPIMTRAGFTAFIDVDDALVVDIEDGIDVADEAIEINEADVVETDIEARNGIIHGIEAVLMPPDILRALRLAGRFDTLLLAIERADLLDDLQAEGPFTLFAPTDEAFEELPDDALEDMSNEELRNLLLFHVVQDRLLAEDLTGDAVETMVDGAELDVAVSGDQIVVHGARVVSPDIITTNGVIHVIDNVLMPAP